MCAGYPAGRKPVVIVGSAGRLGSVLAKIHQEANFLPVMGREPLELHLERQNLHRVNPAPLH